MRRWFDTRVLRAFVMAGGLVALLGSATSATAQMELAVIQGTVIDDAGKPLEGVSCKLKDLNRGREIELKTDKTGKFYRRGLQALEYEINVSKDGYQPINDKIKLVAGTDRRFDFKLAKASPVGSEEFVKGVEAFNKGDNQGAITAFEEALKKAPDALEVRVNLAIAYMRAGRPNDAIPQLEKAAALAPDDPRSLFQLGGAYVEVKQYDKAVAAFEKGLAKQPDLKDALAFEATNTLGAIYFAQGKIDEAVAQFQKALAVQPTAPGPNLGLGKCAFSKGNVDEALKYFNQVATSSPGTPEAAEAEAFIKELKKAGEPD